LLRMRKALKIRLIKIRILKCKKNHKKANKKGNREDTFFLRMITTTMPSIMLFGLIRKCQPKDRS